MDPEQLCGLGGDVLPAVDIGAAVVEHVAGVEDIGRVVVDMDLQHAGEHIGQLLAVVRVRREVAAAGLDHAEHRIHHVLVHRNEREHLETGVALQLDRLAGALTDEAVFLRGGLHEVQRALAVEMRELVEHIQRDIAAVFQLALVRDGNADGAADLLERIALLLANLPPFFAHQLFGVEDLLLLLDVGFQIARGGGGHQHLDGMRAHVLVDGVFLDLFEHLDIVQREDAVVAGGALGGDEAVLFPVPDGRRDDTDDFGDLIDRKGYVVFMIHTVCSLSVDLCL